MHVCIEDADCDVSDVACDRCSKGESTHVVVYRILTPFKRHCGSKATISKRLHTKLFYEVSITLEELS